MKRITCAIFLAIVFSIGMNNPLCKAGEKVRTFSMQEVSRHNSKKDCWMVIHNKVYDVTRFVSRHPGGSSILQGCGKDATKLFETRPMGSGTPHSKWARKKLKNFFIGDLKK